MFCFAFFASFHFITSCLFFFRMGWRWSRKKIRGRLGVALKQPENHGIPLAKRAFFILFLSLWFIWRTAAYRPFASVQGLFLFQEQLLNHESVPRIVLKAQKLLQQWRVHGTVFVRLNLFSFVG